MSTLALYAIVDELAELDALLAESGGELTEDTEALLDRLEGDLSSKIERICQYRQNALRTAEAYKAEADRCAARARTLGRTADSLRDYLHAQLCRAGRDKLEAGVFRLRVQRNSQPSVHVTVDPAALPEQFRRVTIAADLRALLDASKRGEPLPAGVLIETSTHLRIG